MALYSADFETIATEGVNETRIWAYAIIEIGNDKNFIYGNNMTDFIKFCKDSKNSTFYFHNLKFDGEFIIDYLLKNGFTHVVNNKDIKDNTFTTLISDTGQFYSMTVYFKVYGKRRIKATFLDSLKIFNMSVADIAKGFGLTMSKLEIDYKEYREEGHELTKQEIDYIYNDVAIVAKALEFFILEQGYDKMTIGSNAINVFKNMFGKEKFKKVFPPPAYDEAIRPAYKGGFTYVNEEFLNKEIGKGWVLDVNSLYPWAMAADENLYPYGEPLRFEGEYIQDELYPLYFITFSCNFRIKKGKLPMLQIKKSRFFKETEYLKSSDGEDVVLTLNNVDLELFFEHYDVGNIEYLGGYKFKARSGFFKDYINKFTEKKINAKAEGNKAMYLTSKLFLNNLYGKFSTNPVCRTKIPYLENNIVKYKYGEYEEREPVYIPVGAFVTSYARRKTISTAQLIEDNYFNGKSKIRFIYADTDSLHCWDEDDEGVPEFIEVDDYKLGAWKKEFSFIRGKYLRAKCYIEEGHEKDDEPLELKKTVAGCPDICKEQITWENFKLGAVYTGKLRPKHIEGGVILEETTFEIRK